MSLARASLLALALASIGAAVIWTWFQLDSGTSVVSATAPAEVAVPSTTASVPEALPEPPVVVESASRDVVAAPPPPTPIDAPVASNSELALRGRVTLRDAQGIELPPPDGRFRLLAWRGNTASHQEVEVHAGSWSVSVPDASAVDALSIASLEIGGSTAVIDEPRERFPIPPTREIEVRSHVPRKSILRVMAAETGAELNEVVIVRADRYSEGDTAHPGSSYDEHVVLRDGRSPIDLAALAGTRKSARQPRLLVGVAGFAWQAVAIDFDRGGEFLVSLARGADLDVVASGVDPQAKVRLRLRASEEERPVVDEDLGRDGATSLAGLEPGHYFVRGELGEWYSSPIVLGKTEVELRAGERTRVQLALEAAPHKETATAGGVVYVPKEWKQERAMVTLNLLDTPLAGGGDHFRVNGDVVQSDREGFDAFRWTQKDIQTGRYELGIHKPSFSVAVVLPPGGRSDFELVVPPPVELRLFVVDDATGEEVVTDQIMWNPERPEGVTGGSLENAERNAEQHCYIIRAPACEIGLMVWSWGHLPYNTSIDLARGVREHSIRLQRACGIVLHMKDGDTPIAFPEDWQSEVTAISGNGTRSLVQFGTFERKLMVTEPGTYSLDMPKVAGYLQPPVQKIEVFAGQFVEHVVELERERH